MIAHRDRSMRKAVIAAGTLLLMLLVGSTAAHATYFTLGEAGKYSVVAVSGQKSTTFSSGTTDVTGSIFIGTCTGSPCLTFSGGGTMQGSVNYAQGASITVSGGSSAAGGFIQKTTAYADQVKSDLDSALALIDAIFNDPTYAKQTHTDSYKSGGTITATPGAKDGITLIDITNVKGLETSGSTLTFSGGENDIFIVRTPLIKMGGGGTLLSGSGKPGTLLFVVTGDVTTGGNSNTNGTIIARSGNITISGGTHNGAFILGQAGKEMKWSAAQGSYFVPFQITLPKEWVRSSPVVTGDQQMFLGSFMTPSYKGHFRSYNALASDLTNASYTFYDAATRFPTADGRRLYYQNPSTTAFKPFTTANLSADYAGAFTGMTAQQKEALVNSYRGKTAQTDPVTGTYKVDGSGNLLYSESWKLGPVQYSTPALVGYSSNVEGGATRPRVAYVVDGWGVLHAFFAPEIPKTPDSSPVITVSWTNADFANAVAAAPSKYKLSGTLNAGGAGDVTLTNLEPGAEIYGWVTDNQKLTDLKNYGTWYTQGISAAPKSADVMVEVATGVRKYRTLLAVPQGQGTTNVPVLDVTDPLKPTLKYLFKSATAGDAYSQIGHSKSFAIGRVFVNDGSMAELRTYLFYATESMEKIGGFPVPGITMAAVDLESGAVAWRVTMPYSDASIPNDIPAGPSIVDANGDGIIDYVFAGDYEGRVWALYASRTGRTDGSGNPVPGGDSIFGKISSKPVPLANLGKAEPVAVVPTIYKEGTRLNVVFGTGGTDWAPSKNPSTGADVFYNVYSYDAANALSSPSLSTGGATQQWVYKLPAGEKVYGGIVKSGPYLFLGTAYGTALNPSNPIADIPTAMSQSGHLVILQSTGATQDSSGTAITRQVARIQVGKIVAALDVRKGKIFHQAVSTDDTAVKVNRNITGTGTADASLIGNQPRPGDRIEVLYWGETR